MRKCLDFVGKRKGELKDVLSECIDCVAYCSLFPTGYDIEADELVQLWMGAGLIVKEPMEHIGFGYLKALHDFGSGFVSFSREDRSTGNMWFRMNNFTTLEPILDMSSIRLAREGYYSDDQVQVLTNTAETEGFLHASFFDLSPNLGFISGLTRMRTLLLLKGHGSMSHIEHVPYGFFMSLDLLQTLDLSGTKVSELPSSIGAAKSLRYLDLSETFIKRLPETIDCLTNLQTLKLRNCPRLVALPKSTRNITSLRHLDLGTLCHLRSMPPRMGALTQLYTLSNFVVGWVSRCRIGELKHMNNLKGKVCFSRLENVRSPSDAEEAKLQFKRGITMLELRWTDNVEWEITRGDDSEIKAIEHLKPPVTLQDLRIVCYGGWVFPSWIGNHRYSVLKTVTLFKCENCILLPSLWELPSLESLSLIELPRVRVIDFDFCITGTSNVYRGNLAAFPKLKKLHVKSMHILQEWRNMEKVCYFPCLTKLRIMDCPQLTTLCKLSSISCLGYLEISHCSKLPSLPEGGLPGSMKTFVVDDCPLLSLSSLDETQDWHKVELTSSLLIYQRNEDNHGESASVTVF